MAIDYTQFKAGGSGSTEIIGAPEETKFWWEVEGEKVAERVVAAGKELEGNSQHRHLSNLINARLYGNFDIAGFGAREYSFPTGAGLYMGSQANKLGLNATASCIDTLASKICKNKPRPDFVTDGASWPMQQKARKLTKFMQAVFHETQIHKHAQQATFDKYIFGTGALEVYIGDDGRIAFKRAFIDEFFVDDADGVYGKPKQLLRRKLVSKAWLLANFPEQRDVILKAGDEDSTQPKGRGKSDVLVAWEAWHLPSKKGAKNGRHVIALTSGVVLDEVWKLDCFPFVFSTYRKRVLGFWGQGLCEILMGLQVAVNRTFRSIDEQIRRKGKGRIFAPINSVNEAQIDNAIASIVFYKGGVPPTVDASGAVSQDEMMHLQNLYQKIFQEAGLSELSAQSKKPEGLDAAVALREFNDIETERFILEGQSYEQMFMDATEIALDLIRETKGKGYKVRLPNKRFLIELDWADIGLEKDEYVMQMFPVSSLPSTPSARLQRIEELRMGGYIDMPFAKRLLDFPDIDAEMNLANAALDDVDACISMILDDATPKMPDLEIYQSLDMVIERATTQYLFAKHHNCEERRLEMLRNYIDAATEKKVKLLQPPPMPMAPGMPPPAPGGAGGDATVINNIPPAGPAPVAPPVIA